MDIKKSSRVKIFLFIIIINLFILYYYSFIFNHEAMTKNTNVVYKIPENVHEIKMEKSNQKKAEKRLIILAAMYRSGSSFLGSLFDQNPNLLYYFEPLSLFSWHSNAMKYKLQMLQGNKFIIFSK